MDNGRVLALATTLAHESCESVSVADAGRLLDGARNVVVVVAEFVGEQLDLVWGITDCIEQYGEASRHGHTLLCGH